jgi:hypothetical protein
LLVLIPLFIYLLKRKFSPAMGLALALTVIAAAAGLWSGVSLSYALMALIGVLAAWDLDGFERRLAFAAQEDDPRRLERKHLMWLNLALLVGVSIDLLSQTIHSKFGFEWAFMLAILAFYGAGALVSGLGRGDT